MPSITLIADLTALQRLRVVDILADEGVWATLDEGCNSCCHSKAWARNAEDKFEKLGFFPEWFHRDRKTYSGIGGQSGTATTGKKR